MPDLYQIARDFLTERYTVQVELGISGLPKPLFFAYIYNPTKDVPLVVHQVRVHYGSKSYNRFFRLFPFDPLEISPKMRGDFHLSYEPYETIVGLCTLHKTPPLLNPYTSDDPGIESPAQLFNAIGMGKASDSWIEIDFNNYENRRYFHGKIKGYFDQIGLSMRDMRRREQQQ